MKKSLAIEHTYIEHSYYQRLAVAKEAGFAYVELEEWTELDFSTIHIMQKDLSLGISAISGSQGHTLTDPKSHGFFLEHLSQSIAVARSFSCTNLVITFAPGGHPGSRIQDTGDYTRVAFATGTLMDAAKSAAKAGMTLQLKPTGSPGRPVSAQIIHSAADVVRAVDSPALRLYFDAKPMQRLEGDVARSVHSYRDIIGYVHVSNTPDGNCGVDLKALRTALEEDLDYQGFVGFAFASEATTSHCLEAARLF